MRSWLRVVISPFALAFWWCLIVVPMVGLRFLWVQLIETMPDEEIQRIALVYFLFGSASFGCYRFCAHHPNMRPGYKWWLFIHPWKPGDPLPFGPIHLVWQDLFVMAVFVIPAYWLIGEKAIYLPATMLAAYAVDATGTFFVLQPRSYAYVLAFLLGGLACTLVLHPLWTLGASLVCYGVTLFGLRQNLQQIPWDTIKYDFNIGSPMRWLTPHPEPNTYARWEGVVWGLLIGWAAFVVTFMVLEFQKLPATEAYKSTQWFLVVAIGQATLAYFGHYLPGHGSPLGLEGRIRSRRFIIPKYDVVFVAPLLAMIVPFSLWSIFQSMKLHSLVGIPICFTLPTIILVCCGPNRLRWQLTAPVRMGENSGLYQMRTGQHRRK